MARSLNKVTLIGNLTRDPELRYTPQGTAVCTFGLATNRQWATDTGEKKEDVEFHRIVCWQKLAEICAQLLGKGKKVYVEGRLQTRKWTGKDEVERTTTEIVINEMIILDSKGTTSGPISADIPDEALEDFGDVLDDVADKKDNKKDKKDAKPVKSKKLATSKKSDKSKADSDDIPF